MSEAKETKYNYVSVSLEKRDFDRVERIAELNSTDKRKVSASGAMRIAIQRLIDAVADGKADVSLLKPERVRTSISISDDLLPQISELKSITGLSVTEIVLAGLELCEKDRHASANEVSSASDKLDVLIDLCRRIQEQNQAATGEVIRVAKAISSE